MAEIPPNGLTCGTDNKDLAIEENAGGGGAPLLLLQLKRLR